MKSSCYVYLAIRPQPTAETNQQPRNGVLAPRCLVVIGGAFFFATQFAATSSFDGGVNTGASHVRRNGALPRMGQTSAHDPHRGTVRRTGASILRTLIDQSSGK